LQPAVQRNDGLGPENERKKGAAHSGGGKKVEGLLLKLPA